MAKDKTDGGGSTGPLHGLVVADFSRVLAGPLASMYLADLGATVIKVERPVIGDDTRSWGPPYVGDTSTYFASVNRNKQSITLDLADPADLDAARSLARAADVLIENFKPGGLGRFGLDYATTATHNPALVYASISGFGSGAGATLAGYDFVVQAAGGLMSITGESGGPPTKVGVALIDVITGLNATIGILAALQERERSGLGQHVEVDLLSSSIASLVNQGSGFINGAGVPTAMGNRHPSIAPYETLQTADGVIAVAAGNDGQFAVLAAEIGDPDLALDERFRSNRQRVQHRVELVERLEQRLTEFDAAYWSERLARAGIPCSPVNDVAEAIELAASLGLNPVQELDAPAGPIAVLSNPVRLRRTPAQYRTAPPALGADSAAVRQWLREAVRGEAERAAAEDEAG